MSGEGATVLEWQGESLHLRADGSLHWPREATLFLADLHLGKGTAFRARGIPVPTGDTRGDLERLDRAVEETGAERVAILGDLFHARESRAPHVEEALSRWRARHAAAEVLLVRGNHDRRAGDPDPALGMEVASEPWPLGPFLLRHHPPESAPPGGAVLAGHLHPVARLRGPGGDRARLRCFWVRDRVLVLPAWGAFTGGHAVTVGRGDRVFVPVEGSVVEVGS